MNYILHKNHVPDIFNKIINASSVDYEYIEWWKNTSNKGMRKHADNDALLPAATCKAIEYPKPDNEITFDIATSLYRSGTNHDHDQPSHLKILQDDTVGNINYDIYLGPEGRYCPAKVYEYVESELAGEKPKLTINAQNCLHCKACSIKDPTQNILWTVPEGGGGPKYTLM